MHHTSEGYEELVLPDANELVMEGVTWGHPYEVPSVAYWTMLAWSERSETQFSPRRVGTALRDQIVYCMLGGYGMPAELGILAFNRLQSRGLLSRVATAEELESALQEPLEVEGRSRRYRFAQQKARYVAAALREMSSADLPREPLALRGWLCTLPGVGYKTASWIVRDWHACDDVAIIDIHIERACRALAVFQPQMRVARDYLEMEGRFLALARAMKVRASVLDNLMWATMRSDGAVLSGAKAV
ncbi:MAG: 8-oxoguanine DNA glycosylase [Vulcanimicrobiaceae bacterium]